MQTDSNQGQVFVWRYPEEEFHKDCIRGTVLSGFQKVKIWGAMRYGKLSNLVCMPAGKDEGKMTAKKYLDLIMDKEMFDFWLEGMISMLRNWLRHIVSHVSDSSSNQRGISLTIEGVDEIVSVDGCTAMAEVEL